MKIICVVHFLFIVKHRKTFFVNGSINFKMIFKFRSVSTANLRKKKRTSKIRFVKLLKKRIFKWNSFGHRHFIIPMIFLSTVQKRNGNFFSTFGFFAISKCFCLFSKVFPMFLRIFVLLWKNKTFVFVVWATYRVNSNRRLKVFRQRRFQRSLISVFVVRQMFDEIVDWFSSFLFVSWWIKFKQRFCSSRRWNNCFSSFTKLFVAKRFDSNVQTDAK